MEGPTSFVTLTHCCQEPKNTFINGKTGMAPQRNILTSPEEPAGRFRAHPQEAWVSYLLGSPPGGESAARFSRQGACPISARGSQARLPGLDRAGLIFCNVARSTPHPAYSSRSGQGGWWRGGTVASLLVTAPCRCSPLWRLSFDCKRSLELAPDISPGSQVPTSARWARQVATHFLSSPRTSSLGP